MTSSFKLNPEQEKAVLTTHGRVLILAGAGSGKTRVIVCRMAHLISTLKIPPQNIVGLTFTNKAAAEMRHRLQTLISPKEAKQVTLATFHSFCMQILRKEIDKLGYTRDFSLYDERDYERIMKQLIKQMLGHEGDLPSLAATREALTHLESQVSEKDPKNKIWHDQFTQDLHTRLQNTLRAYNAVNFDNLIKLTVRLFEEHPDVLDRYQDQYQYIMIDEYQDTDPAQFRLAELLTKKHENLCVVGDDDQSIYGWRGAKLANILQFKADTIIKLEQNYRSTPLILEAANTVIANNKNRHQKKLWSNQTHSELIEIFNATNEQEEAEAIIHRLIHLHSQGFSWKDMAILYRSNALSRQFEMSLINASWKHGNHWVRGIPYEIFGGLEFSERSEIKDILSFLRVIANPKDEEALLRIINIPRRGISDSFLDEITKMNRSQNIALWDLLKEIAEGKIPFPQHPRGIAGVQNFVQLIHKATQKFSHPPLHEGLAWLLEEINYKKVIEEEVKSDKMRTFKWENVQECVNALAQYEQENEPILQEFIANTTLIKSSFSQHTEKSKEDKVQLMTLHSAKGLEFPICFIVGLEDHNLPHEKSKDTTGIEEERRLFYVGITRSQKKLTLSMARSRMRMGKIETTNPSRFLFEIPKHLLKVTTPKSTP